MSRLSVFLAKILTASASALSVRIFLISLSMDGAISLLYASAMVSCSRAKNMDFSFFITDLAMMPCMSSELTVILTLSFFSFSPLFMARTRWLGILEMASCRS